MNPTVQLIPALAPALAAGWGWLRATARRLHWGTAPWRAMPQGHGITPSADDAVAVRALAHSVRREMPGFASDLDAAVDRYERECASLPAATTQARGVR